jgi:hypothetical protein
MSRRDSVLLQQARHRGNPDAGCRFSEQLTPRYIQIMLEFWIHFITLT